MGTLKAVVFILRKFTFGTTTTNDDENDVENIILVKQLGSDCLAALWYATLLPFLYLLVLLSAPYEGKAEACESNEAIDVLSHLLEDYNSNIRTAALNALMKYYRKCFVFITYVVSVALQYGKKGSGSQ